MQDSRRYFLDKRQEWTNVFSDSHRGTASPDWNLCDFLQTTYINRLIGLTRKALRQ